MCCKHLFTQCNHLITSVHPALRAGALADAFGDVPFVISAHAGANYSGWKNKTILSQTGHHHLIIDAPLPDTAFAIPKDAKHRHFGGGQTQVTLELTPGTHTLQLLLGDFRHIPHNPPVSSKRITITVE